MTTYIIGSRQNPIFPNAEPENIIYVNNRYNDIISEITGFIGDAKFHISFDVDCLDPEQLFTSTNRQGL